MNLFPTNNRTNYIMTRQRALAWWEKLPSYAQLDFITSYQKTDEPFNHWTILMIATFDAAIHDMYEYFKPD